MRISLHDRGGRQGKTRRQEEHAAPPECNLAAVPLVIGPEYVHTCRYEMSESLGLAAIDEPDCQVTWIGYVMMTDHRVRSNCCQERQAECSKRQPRQDRLWILP